MLRKMRGISQSELGRRANVTPQAIQSLEADQNPNRKTKHVISIASALSFDPVFLDLTTSNDQFKASLAAHPSVGSKVHSSTPIIDSSSESDDDELIDAAIVQARNNINLRLQLSGKKISGREYLESLSEELRRLTANNP